MIQAITIAGIKYDIDERTLDYLTKKIAVLDKYIPRHARKTASAEAKLRRVNRDHGNKYEAEVILKLPGAKLTAKDSTVNMMAAIDIVEAKLIAQLHHYKETAVPHIAHKRVLSRLKRAM